MKPIQKLFHKMMNEFIRYQGCSSIHMGMAKYFDVLGLSLTVIRKYVGNGRRGDGLQFTSHWRWGAVDLVGVSNEHEKMAMDAGFRVQEDGDSGEIFAACIGKSK